MVNFSKKLPVVFFMILIGIIMIIFFNIMPISAADVHKLPTKTMDMAPFYWIVGIVGGCIAATLTYVSWKKYKVEEKKQTKKDRTH